MIADELKRQREEEKSKGREDQENQNFLSIFMKNLTLYNISLDDEFNEVKKTLEIPEVNKVIETCLEEEDDKEKGKDSIPKSLDKFVEDYKKELNLIKKETIEIELQKNSQETIKKEKPKINLSPENSSLSVSEFFKKTPSKQGKKTPIDMIPKMLEELKMNEGSDFILTPQRKGSFASPNIKTVKRKYFNYDESNQKFTRRETLVFSVDDLSDDIEEVEEDLKLGKRDQESLRDNEENKGYQEVVKMRNLEKLGVDKTIKKLKKIDFSSP